MQNTVENTNQIIVANSNLKSFAPRKSAEKVGGIPVSKAKLTNPTYLTLRHNITINEEILKKTLDQLNAKLAVAFKDIVAQEEKKAEEDLIKKITPETKEEKPVNENVETLKIVRKINNATKKEKIESVFQNNGALLTYKESYLDGNKIAISSSSKPKAIMIPAILQNICLEIGKGISKYDVVEKKENIKSSNWENLFDFIKEDEIKEDEINVDENINIDDEQITNNTLTTEEFEKRKLQANIGEELKDIRKLLQGFGQSNPFKEGLIKREEKLKKMLEEIGIFNAVTTYNYSNGKSTDIQKKIDEITGYKEPLSKEEYDKKEMEINEYYSNPEVMNIIDDLRLKNKLFDMNKPEAYEKIDEAERIDNEKRSEKISSELVSEIDVEKKFIDTDSKNEEEKAKEINYIKNGAKEQARLLVAKKNRDLIIEGAKEEAKMLNRNNEILSLANAYAKDIHNFNMILDSAQKYANDIYNHDLVKESAEKYAKDINEYNTRYAKIMENAKKYAEDIYKKYFIKDMADKYANDINTLNKIIDNAKKYAEDIFNKNKIIDSAEEYAKKINEMNKIVDLAKTYAKDIFARNNRIDIMNAAEEQARILNAQNQIADIMKESEERLKNTMIPNKVETKENSDEIKKKLDEIVERSYNLINNNNQKVEINSNDIEEANKQNDEVKKDDIEVKKEDIKEQIQPQNQAPRNETEQIPQNKERFDEEKRTKRLKDIENARKMVDELLGKMEVHKESDINMHESGKIQAKMLQERYDKEIANNSKEKPSEETYSLKEPEIVREYDVVEINSRYLNQVESPKKIKLQNRERVDNIIKSSNTLTNKKDNDNLAKTLKRTL